MVMWNDANIGGGAAGQMGVAKRMMGKDNKAKCQLRVGRCSRTDLCQSHTQLNVICDQTVYFTYH